MNKLIIAIVVIVLVLGGFLIFGNQETVSVQNENTNATSSVSEVVDGEVKEFVVTGSGFSFTPSTIRVNKGDRVRIVFKNANGMHDFVLDEFNVATAKINAGQEETVEFVADTAGSFEYYCSVGNHRAQGMKGTLIVE